MNPSLTSAVSEISKGRSPAERSSKPSLRTRVRNLITRVRLGLGKVVSFPIARILLIFVIGFAAGIAWQSYGGAARKAIAGWSPRLSWLAPEAASGGTSPERIKAMSLAVATARQSLDKLSTEISRLEVQDGNAPRRRAAR